MRAANVLMGLVGAAGGVLMLTSTAAVYGLGAPAFVVGLLAGVGLVAEVIGIQQVLTGLFGGDDEQ